MGTDFEVGDIVYSHATCRTFKILSFNDSLIRCVIIKSDYGIDIGSVVNLFKRNCNLTKLTTNKSLNCVYNQLDLLRESSPPPQGKLPNHYLAQYTEHQREKFSIPFRDWSKDEQTKSQLAWTTALREKVEAGRQRDKLKEVTIYFNSTDMDD